MTGIDITDQPRYPYRFILGDALAAGAEYLRYEGFDAIHASPPCQAHTKAQRLQGRDHPDLIAATRGLLVATGLATGLPYVIIGDALLQVLDGQKAGQQHGAAVPGSEGHQQ